MREKWKRFMTGRYGTDQLNLFLLGLVIILNLFVHTDFIYYISLGCLVWCMYRMFSKRYEKRSGENAVYLGYMGNLRRLIGTERVAGWKFKVGQRLEFHIYRCPGCKQKIRIPRRKGKISIHCPKCGTDFIRKS